MKNNKDCLSGRQGFTLIELLVVVAIIGLLSTLAVVSLNNARAKARDAKRISDIKQIQTALELCFNDGQTYPSDLLTTTACGASNSLVDYIDPIPVNPTPGGSTYTYTQIGSGSGYTLTFTLEGQTGSLQSGLHTATEKNIQ